MSVSTIPRSSEICDPGRVVGTMFEWWFSAAAPHLVFFSKGNYVVVLSFNPDVSRQFMSALNDFIQSLASHYPAH